MKIFNLDDDSLYEEAESVTLTEDMDSVKFAEIYSQFFNNSGMTRTNLRCYFSG